MAKIRVQSNRSSGRTSRVPRRPGVGAAYRPSMSIGQTIVGVIGWAGAGGFLCLLIFLSVNMGRRTSVLDEEMKADAAEFKEEAAALESRQSVQIAELEAILSKERKKQMDSDRELKESARELSQLQKKTKTHRRRMESSIRRALTGMDPDELLEDGQTLSDLSPDDIVAALEARKEALEAELAELKGATEDVAMVDGGDDAAANDWGGQGRGGQGGGGQPRVPERDRQSVDPAKVRLGASVQKVKEQATDTTPFRWLLDPVVNLKNLDTAVACRNLTLEYLVYGRHLTRDDTFVMYFRDVKTVDLPAGASLELRFNKVYLGRDATDPSDLDARYEGYIINLRDEAGTILYTRANQNTFQDVQATKWADLARGDIFDTRLERNGRVPMD